MDRAGRYSFFSLRILTHHLNAAPRGRRLQNLDRINPAEDAIFDRMDPPSLKLGATLFELRPYTSSSRQVRMKLKRLHIIV